MALQEQRQRAALLALVLASLGCAGLVAARALFIGRFTFRYFCWNLFLAWIPLALSIALARRHASGQKGQAASWALGAAWLVFFPNAPYLVTDLVHLRARHPVPFWFDALLMSAFALTGLCLGFLSLLQVHGLVARARGPRAGWLFVAIISGLTGVGIYLGRVHRWNSWDVVTRPGELLESLTGWALDPLSSARGLAVAALFGGVFGAAYLLLLAVARRQSVPLSGDSRSTSRHTSTTSWPSRR
jgi:uncharacterized membrane protein